MSNGYHRIHVIWQSLCHHVHYPVEYETRLFLVQAALFQRYQVPERNLIRHVRNPRNPTEWSDVTK